MHQEPLFVHTIKYNIKCLSLFSDSFFHILYLKIIGIYETHVELQIVSYASYSVIYKIVDHIDFPNRRTGGIMFVHRP